MQLVVGLGNPGPQYAETRHNIGFRVVASWAERQGWRFEAADALEALVAVGRHAGSRVALLLPQTFMNHSGRAVAHAVQHFALDDPGDLLVVYDDLDLPFGRFRLRPSGGAGGHRGLGDIQARLGSNEFPRLRVGIGRPSETEDIVDYVLSPFDPAERAELGALLLRGAEAVDDILRSGVRAAMNRVNAPPSVSPRPGRTPADD